MEGHFVYKGLIASQHPSVEEPFRELIREIKPEQILEIGTAYGGLTMMLRDLLDENALLDTKIKSFDIHGFESHKQLLRDPRIEINVSNIFDKGYKNLLDEQIPVFIGKKGTTLVLCDGGHKPSEFNILSRHLKRGDIIMAHDYSPNRDSFEKEGKEQIWAWCEITDKDIAKACEDYGLEDFMPDKFKKVAWVCKKKT